MQRIVMAVVLSLLGAGLSGCDPEPGEPPATLFGAAVNADRLQETAFADTLRTHGYDSLTAENGMKFADHEPAQGQFDFTSGDAIVGHARANGMQVHGHTLIWHRSLPGWLTSRSWTEAELTAILRNHVANVVGHYRGRVRSWDVVNEALNDDGTWRRSLWYDTIGPEYVEIALRAAERADPAATLYYNDYNIEPQNTKSRTLLALLDDYRDRGVPIDAVGFQMHKALDSNLVAQDFAANVERFTDVGLQVAISEMDVRIGEAPGSPVKLAAQADYYERYARICASNPGCIRFTTWGITDKYTWVPGFTGTPDAPLPFDTSYRPKPAYHSLHEVLRT